MDGETASHELVDVVDLSTLEILGAELVYIQLDAAEGFDGIAFHLRVFEPHPVLEAGASAGSDEDAQAEVIESLLLHEVLELHICLVCQANHRDPPERPRRPISIQKIAGFSLVFNAYTTCMSRHDPMLLVSAISMYFLRQQFGSQL